MKSSAFKSISVLTAILIVAGLGIVAPPASAQCFGPDGLDFGPCCAPVIPNLPAFPDANPPALGICWNNCSVSGTQDLRVIWSAPSQVACTQYVSQITVIDGITGVPLLSGLMTLDYTRTWLEDDATGVPIQVWRFVAKADLSGVAGGAFSPCVQPSCIAPAGPHPTAYYYGYVDYATCDVGPGTTWEQTLVLYHACDRFIHTPGLSNRPGVFHPAGAFAIVAPHSAVQPFVPSDVMATSGPLVAEATRNLNTTPLCVVEDRVVDGSITKIGAGCICTLSKNPKHQSFRDYKGQTACVGPAGIPGSWNTLFVLFPTLPWIHLVSTSIGSWTSPGVYPGTERVWADEGLFLIHDACTGDFVEIKYGASTRGGFPIIPTPVGPPLTPNFTDLGDNYTAPLSGPFPSPAFGTIQPTDHLVYTNN